MNSDTPLDPMGELQALQSFFTEAEARLQAGQIVDMSGIDVRIAQVCKLVQKSPTDKQQAYLVEMTTLIEQLGHYEKELRRLQTAFDQASSPENGNA